MFVFQKAAGIPQKIPDFSGKIQEDPVELLQNCTKNHPFDFLTNLTLLNTIDTNR